MAANVETQDILNRVFDAANNQLATTNVGAASATPATKDRSVQEIWNRVFDASTNKLRVVS